MENPWSFSQKRPKKIENFENFEKVKNVKIGILAFFEIWIFFWKMRQKSKKVQKRLFWPFLHFLKNRCFWHFLTPVLGTFLKNFHVQKLNLVVNEVSFESLRRAINDESIKNCNKKCLTPAVHASSFDQNQLFWGKNFGKIFWGENLEMNVKSSEATNS